MTNTRRTRKGNFRRPSSFSTITESPMSRNVITVTLNMDTSNFLGILTIGQRSAMGSNILVSKIIEGGVVELDGRIKTGDMILRVNDASLENITNDQAMEVLRLEVERKGPIMLTVALCLKSGQKNCLSLPWNPREEPVVPLDTKAWVEKTIKMKIMWEKIEDDSYNDTQLMDESEMGCSYSGDCNQEKQMLIGGGQKKKGPWYTRIKPVVSKVFSKRLIE